jgi:hypothetical protein
MPVIERELLKDGMFREVSAVSITMVFPLTKETAEL